MAEISFDFRNIVRSKKCAVSSPRRVNLEIRDESPDSPSEPAFQDLLFIDHVCRNDVKNTNLICGCDKQNDKNFLINSPSSLSTSTCDDPFSDKIKSTSDSDIDFNSLNLLDSFKSEQKVETGAEQFNPKKNISDDKMKIISNFEISVGSSDIVHPICEKDEVDATCKCQRKFFLNNEIDLLDFDFCKNECAYSLSSNNSSLKVESNLSDLLSSINIEDSDVAKVGSFNSNSLCNSKVTNKFETVKEPCDADLSDLLSSIAFGSSNDNKDGSCNQGNKCSTKVAETENSCLADLLSYSDIDKSNKPTSEKEPCVINLSDLLSSVDLGDCNDGGCNQTNMCNNKVAEIKRELCLSSGLPSVNINKSDMPTSAVLNSKSLSFGSSNLYAKETNGKTNLLDDLTFDILSCSSSNSCSSSYSDKENNSPVESLTENNLLTDKVLETDSGWSSFDSAHKEFSFFDYSTDNKFSFNTLLTNKSDTNIAMRNGKSKDARNSNEEMSMSDLMTIVSPELKNPVMETLNKAEKLVDCVDKGSSSVLDFMESLNMKSKNSDSHIKSNCSAKYDGKLMNYDCVDSPVSRNVQSSLEIADFEGDVSSEKDVLVSRYDYVNEDDKIISDDEQINFIDLRECIKSAKHQFIPTSPIRDLKSSENQHLKCFSPKKILFYNEDKSPLDISQNKSNSFEFNDTAPKKKSRVNTKQTMFSKALSCKPKKDNSLLQKVANIKNELLNSIINRPVFIDCVVPQPIMKNVIQSDRCILSGVGRKSFGLDAPCELQ